MSIAENINEIRSQLPPHVTLVAVSKTKPNEALLEAYQAGQRIFGENKVQELTQKYETLPKDIEWHFIGHLQTNKVKFIAPFISLIHAVDSLKLLEAINKEATKNQRVINCLLQFHIAEEETKFGLSMEEAVELLTSETFSKLTNVKIVGVMGMATFTENSEQIEKEFGTLKQYFDHLKTHYFSEQPHFKEISMGMSDDFLLAIKQGSTMVRIGSTIFGARVYPQNV
jgi:pyridoxal phosphate enzyme (YggS family)